jgi:hypothetical protein
VTGLRAREEIRDCVYRYARGVDRFDRGLVESAFFPDAIIDQGMFVGGPAEFVDWAFALHAEVHLAHQHVIANHLSWSDGAGARAETYFLFFGVNRSGEPAITTSGGRYLDALEQRDDEWRIVGRVVLRDWSSTGPAGPGQSALAPFLDGAATKLLRDGPEPARDRTDPSYDLMAALGRAGRRRDSLGR